MLAPYATQFATSRGRLYPEAEDPIRTPFQRDRDRVMHATAFRRLKYKTQVFVNHEGDHFRTRLTHSLEVSQIARTVCRVLQIDEDLGETLALVHDFGHTPFGHAGEDALNACMQPFGGFSHNEQTLRLVTELEERYAKFPGLNLTWEVLEGLVKHNGPVAAKEVPAFTASFNQRFPLELHTHAGLEAQVASLADDIAYSNHDLDDGLRARLFTVEALQELPVVGREFAAVAQRFPDASESQQRFEATRRLMRVMMLDLIETTKANLAALNPQNAADVRGCGKPIAAFSEPMNSALHQLKAFLMQRMYRHYRVNIMSSKAARVVTDLFTLLLAEPQCLPTEWQQKLRDGDAQYNARQIANYIAGMTDRYAQKEHQRLFDLYH
ncbi:MAG: deoxyguanosinetriphosphate triphosphohydrolase [Alphaproteobacteria bacterium]|jgi:dGTPase|nr:deoxyguanosinetriphosphate triphosphohydrolase [Alphaproteobacteria bacterium]